MAEEINFKVNADTKGAEKSIDNLEKGFKGLPGIIGKASNGLKGFGKTLASIGNAVKTGLGFGILLGVLDTFKSVLSENQQVVDLLNQAMVVMQGVVNGVVEVLKPLFVWLGKAFKDPKQWWDDLVLSFQNGAKWIKENMIDQVLNKFVEWANTAKIAVLELRKNWNEFTGDTEEAKKIGAEIEALQKQNIALAEANAKKMQNIKNVVNNVVEGVQGAFKTIAKATKKAFDNKDVLANAEANIQKLQTLYQGIVEKYDLMAEKQRQLRDDENKTIEDRLAANKELQRVLEEGEKKEQENIKARIGIIQMQQNLLGYNKQRANEVLALQQELTGVTAKYAGLMSETLTNEVSLGKEALDIQKSINESKLAQTEITNEALVAEKQAAVDRADLIKNEFEKLKALKDAQKALRDEEIRQLDELNAKRQADFDTQLSQLTKGTAAYQEVLNQKAEAQTQYDADRKTKEIEFATWSAQNEKALTELKISQQEALASAVTGALQSIATAVGEETAAGKTLAVATAIIDTYMGATKALAAGAGTPVGYINAAAIIAAGFSNVRKMVSTPIPGANDTASASAPTGPSVSIVGGSADPSAQIARSLAQQNQKPIKAYAVATDMSTQQALDRRIQQNATFPG
jgi:hypothetical protein